MEAILIFIIWIALGAISAYLANLRGRDPFLWSMGILTLSLIGLPYAVMGIALLYFLPVVELNQDEIPENKEFESMLPEEAAGLTQASIISGNWFYYDQSEERLGPIPFEDLQVAWEQKKINLDTYVWMDGMVSWSHIRHLSNLQIALETNSKTE